MQFGFPVCTITCNVAMNILVYVPIQVCVSVLQWGRSVPTIQHDGSQGVYDFQIYWILLQCSQSGYYNLP